MTRKTTEQLIQTYFAASNQGDSAAVLALMNEDVAHDFNEGTREIGVEKFRWFLATQAAHYKEQLADAVILSSDDGTRGAAEFTLRGTYVATTEGMPKASGQRYAMQAALFFEVEDSKFVRITNYRNMHEWLRQISEE